jgi:uncharacterized membrane-anchored protein
MIKPWADRLLDNEVKGATVAMLAEIDKLRAYIGDLPQAQAEMLVEIKRLNAELASLTGQALDIAVERDELRAALGELKNQEPVAWRFERPGISKLDVWKHGGDWEPLYLAAGAQPKEQP